MIEQIGLYVFFSVWIGSIIGCFVVGVFLEEYKILERYALPMFFIALSMFIIIRIYFLKGAI